MDVFASPYIFEEGTIRDADVYPRLKEGSGTAQYRGVQYYDARDERFNLADSRFHLEQPFDFISMIMTLHHLTRPDEIPEPLLLARDVQWIDDNGEIIAPRYDLTPTQRDALERLLAARESA